MSSSALRKYVIFIGENMVYKTATVVFNLSGCQVWPDDEYQGSLPQAR